MVKSVFVKQWEWVVVVVVLRKDKFLFLHVIKQRGVYKLCWKILFFTLNEDYINEEVFIYISFKWVGGVCAILPILQSISLAHALINKITLVLMKLTLMQRRVSWPVVTIIFLVLWLDNIE